MYWAGRATLVRRPEDVELYDRAFAAWWERVHEIPLASPIEREVVLAFDPDGDDDAPATTTARRRDAPTLAVRYSRAEVLRQRDFAHYSPDEFAESRRLMDDLRMAGAMRRSRRLRASRREPGPSRPAPHGPACAPRRGRADQPRATSSPPNARAGSSCSAT